MKRKKPILVALADVAMTEPTLRRAVSLARRMDVPLHLFRCVYDPVLEAATLAGSPGTFDGRRGLIDVEVARLDKLAARLQARGLQVTSEARWGHPAYTVIVAAAMRSQAQLVVAGTHSYGRATRLLLGHNDWQLARLCPVPLLLVKPGTAYRAPRILAAIDPGHSHDKPAQLDDEILRIAKHWAEALGGKVHVVHTYLPPTPMTVGRFGGDIPQVVLAAHLYSARSAFDSLADKAGIPSARRHFVTGSAQDVLPDVARRLGVQLAVLGCVSRGRLERALIGSTAERVVDRLECDLLIVKPRQFRPPEAEVTIDQ